ncbi:Sigma factor, ECF subfamily [Hyphomicrobium sulfonivorans]|uniref:Sigma factor, ECF subfamily n=1 Tax=Hyphomicrobium sulfonivorans TaxID=121290 RepID=A0A120CYN3_HYPSL|nr:sigma-70 family RNA polymerase sigma factor [Hyphomicrobium sulfonivorans]KWT72792.1 Sigma factor, ECF subfamily [Hyphomicrobium sulfonivorans]
MANPIDVAALYEAESGRLRRKLARMIGDRSTAADLVHDVFLRLWKRDTDIQGCGAAYLTRSAHNAAIDYIRAEKIRASYAAETLPEQRAVGFPAPSAALEARDDLRQIDVAIRQLPERTRHVFLLNRVHGHTYVEIAAALNIAVGSVERHMSRALNEIRAAIEVR